MKKYWHILLVMFCFVLSASSCSDDNEEVIDEAWKLKNEEAF